MSKRKSPNGRGLPLFDLPLHANDEEAAPEEAERLVEDAGDLPLTPRRARAAAAASGSAAVDKTLRKIPVVPADGETANGETADGETADEQLAPLRDRLLAASLDLAIQVVVAGGAVAAVRAMGVPVALADGLPFALFGLIFSFLYWFIPLAFWGQTPGMAWVGNSAVSLSDEPLTFAQTLLRWCGALLTLALAGLPLLLALGGRSLSDRLSESKTVAI